MAVYRRTTRPRYLLLLLLLTAITLITLDYRSDAGGVIDRVRSAARDAFAPVQSAADTVLEPISNVINGVLHYGDIEAENARLREQLAERGAELDKARDAERERQAALDLQDLSYLPDVESVSARVISTSASSFELTITLDKGTGHGIVTGMPVVSGAGLVGRIVEASTRRSVVMLITDPSSSVGVRLSGSGDTGVGRGSGPRRDLRVEHLESSTPVREGEVVVTSGLQHGVFPAGIPVGVVSSPGQPRPAIAEREGVRVVPAVDFPRLAFVKVLLWQGIGE